VRRVGDFTATLSLEALEAMMPVAHRLLALIANAEKTATVTTSMLASTRQAALDYAFRHYVLLRSDFLRLGFWKAIQGNALAP
jgi:hypothetical protein